MQDFQRGYITLVVLIFIAILAFALYPRDFTKITGDPIPTAPASTVASTGNGGSCPESPPNPPESFTSTVMENGAPSDSGQQVNYVMVREGVMIDINVVPERRDNTTCNISDPAYLSSTCHAIPARDVTGADGKSYRLYYPGLYGETDVLSVGTRTFKEFNIIYRVLLDGNGEPAKFPGKDKNGNDTEYHKMDFFQQEGATKMDDGMLCSGGGGGSSSFSGTRVEVPGQEVSENKDQLQLEWFLFTVGTSTTSEAGIFQAHCKPAIYLYPREKQLVNVKVNTKGVLSYVDPKYPQTGWTVTAYPNGDLYQVLSSEYQADKKYSYLYYESKLPDTLIKKPEKGFIVRKSELNTLFNELLPKLGLNSVQSNDFVEYWDKALPDSPYYFVGIVDQAQINNAEPLEITPKPDFINRVRIYFERLDEFKEVDEPEISGQFAVDSSQFNVVEWGGLIKNDPNHPFICSQ